eukprot:COSAG02_NODE_14832_length_1232_cov_0.756399_1_plen_62_part_00
MRWQVIADTAPYGLTAEQVKQIKSVYYDGFHYAGRERMWELSHSRKGIPVSHPEAPKAQSI